MMILPVWSQPISLGTVQTADESTANPQSAEDLSLTATFSGSGTEADPYIIATAADFIALTNDMNASTNHNGHYFKQTANIDLAGNADYVGAQAASSSAHSFYGIYNGCGYTINVDLTATDERFIFPNIYGKVYNLGVTGSINVSNTTYASGFARCVRGTGIVVNCYSNVNVTANAGAAGFTTSNYGKIYNCYYSGTLNGKNNYGFAQTVSNGVSGTCYYTMGTDPKASATAITEEAKTTLAGLLNDGRSDAAAAIGLNESNLYYWYSNNSLPVLVAEEPKPVDIITGTGTADDPYIINSASDFIIFTNALNEGETYSGKYFNQTENIDLAGNENYVVALSSGAFYGYYDGLGHTINVALTATDERNIFPYFYKTIMNLGTTGTMNITGANYTAGITRSVRTGAVLANCYSTMTINANASVGGLCASGNGTLVNCYLAGTLNSGTGNNRAIAVSSSGATFKNCYYTTGTLAADVIATQVTETEAKTILAALLNETRQDAADAANVDRSKISFWTNSNGYPKHFIPSYTDITAEVSNPLIQAGKSESSVITTTADYVSSWKVTNINSDATYTVSDDKKTLTITSGNKAGKVIATAYSADGILISDEIVVTVHSSKVSVPGLNMINGLDTVVDFEDGLGYGLKTRSTNIYYTTADVPTIDYSANKDASGNSVAALENATGKAIVTDGSNMHKGDAWYFYLGTQITTLESGREYSAYAQVYANPDPAQAPCRHLPYRYTQMASRS